MLARLRRRRRLPATCARDGRADGGERPHRRRPAGSRRGTASAPRRLRGGRAEGHVQDGDCGRRELSRRPALRRGRPRSHALPRVPRRHALGRRRRAPRPLRAGGAGAAGGVARGTAEAREPRLLQVPQGWRGARDGSGRRRRAPGSRRRCPRAAGGDPRRPLGALRPFRGARQRPEPARAARPARARPGGASRAARGSRAGGVDRAPLLERGDVARSALGGGARDRGHRAQPPRGRARTPAREARTRSGSATSATRRSSRSRRAGSASRRSTRFPPRSSRSRLRRARSPGREVRSPRTR